MNQEIQTVGYYPHTLEQYERIDSSPDNNLLYDNKLENDFSTHTQDKCACHKQNRICTLNRSKWPRQLKQLIYIKEVI